MAFIQLSHGSTHYELQGPQSGALVVLLHGGSIPMWTWDQQVAALLAAGFRTLRYDMYGKGKSACPAVHYDRELFKTQLSELLERLDIREPIHLVGFSFGGATAANFTASRPEKVRTLSLISPVLRFEEGNAVVRTARLPLIGSFLVRFVFLKKAIQRASTLWAGAKDAERYSAEFRAQIERPGFARALLSFLRSDALGDYSRSYRELGESRRAALLVWGSHDEDVPARHIERIRSLLPLADYHELPGLTHGTVFQASAQVNRLLLAYLGAQSGMSPRTT